MGLFSGIAKFFEDPDADKVVKCPVCGFKEKKKDTDALSISGKMELSDVMEGLSERCIVCEKCGVVFVALNLKED
jgi:hypothetical protein